LLNKHRAVASAACPSLKQKRVTVHRLRHTMAMDLLQAGVDRSVIALWLGHEHVETTQIYLEATLAMKEKALAKTSPPDGTPGRYKPGDRLLAFLEGLTGRAGSQHARGGSAGSRCWRSALACRSSAPSAAHWPYRDSAAVREWTPNGQFRRPAISDAPHSICLRLPSREPPPGSHSRPLGRVHRRVAQLPCGPSPCRAADPG
jgi:hypothetical protein